MKTGVAGTSVEISQGNREKNFFADVRNEISMVH